MVMFDLPLSELREYRPGRVEPPDFDDFWARTLAEARRHDIAAEFIATDSGLRTVDVFDVRFAGWNGERIAAWLLMPRHVDRPVPAVVEYVGYGSGRSLAHQRLFMSAAGFAHLVMDSRGQGSAWRPGVTPDPEPAPQTGQYPGFMTRGIDDPERYYYRRIMTDAARAVEAVRAHPGVDSRRVAVYGRSQGGGLALAAGALVPDVAAIVADVPFLCHYRRASEITDKTPYAEISQYLKARRTDIESVFRTLSYFDGVNFAARATARGQFGVGLMDDVCPPSTVFAAYNHYAGPKDICVWPYNGHEGGEVFQESDTLRFLNETLAPR
ncbi:acetylxylan esterase [Dactylosporangium sp. AC04546]|uniref:acetylxylan esterase n=1 Tax=Dactylosporangium sp. AC04546 TaxID=2862460 RepID=UPI001EDDEE30|nr:acetylxylan esterase [Dactylosporangium sp. AC04546]WVK81029.1 acetylxylan esterase [Dactylosporangium sp. AC04546]